MYFCKYFVKNFYTFFDEFLQVLNVLVVLGPGYDIKLSSCYFVMAASFLSLSLSFSPSLSLSLSLSFSFLTSDSPLPNFTPQIPNSELALTQQPNLLFLLPSLILVSPSPHLFPSLRSLTQTRLVNPLPPPLHFLPVVTNPPSQHHFHSCLCFSCFHISLSLFSLFFLWYLGNGDRSFNPPETKVDIVSALCSDSRQSAWIPTFSLFLPPLHFSSPLPCSLFPYI